MRRPRVKSIWGDRSGRDDAGTQWPAAKAVRVPWQAADHQSLGQLVRALQSGMAFLDRLAWLELARQFSIIGISTDDDPAQASAWLERSHATINQFIDTKLEMENMLGASRIPLTVLIDADGRVVDKIYGAREWDSPESLQLICKAFRNRKGARSLEGAVAGRRPS